MADSELQQLAKTDRNPVQETRYQQLLKEQRESGGGGGGGIDYEKQRQMSLEAVKPAIQSLEAGIPELKAAYTSRQNQVQAEKEPLIQRYEALLSEIKGRETSQVNDTTRNVNREMGRRGIALSSTFAGDETIGRTAPIRGAAQADILATNFDREAKLREIDNVITNISSEMIAAEREIRNTIGQIQATAGTQGVQNAIQIFQIEQAQRQAELDRQLKERELTATIDNARLTANTSAIKEVQGGLFNTQTNQWVVPAKSTGTSTANVSAYLPSAGFVGTQLSGSSALNTNSSSNSGWVIVK